MGAAYFYHLTAAPLEQTLPMLIGKAQGAGWRVVVRGRLLHRAKARERRRQAVHACSLTSARDSGAPATGGGWKVTGGWNVGSGLAAGGAALSIAGGSLGGGGGLGMANPPPPNGMGGGGMLFMSFPPKG